MIRLPENNTRGSELNLGFLVLLCQLPFHGFHAEHPHDHIEKLEDVACDDYSRCKLFSFSLKGETRRWPDHLLSGSLTCWREVRSAFTKYYFDEARYQEARNKTSTFSQDLQEPFKNSWGRFKNYQLECEYHGYSEPQLINIFYRGLNLNYQTTVDTPSDGNFSTKSPEEARKLTENSEKTDIKIRDTMESAEENQLVEVKTTLLSVQALLVSKIRSHKEDEDVQHEQENQVVSIGVAGFQDSKFGFNSGSFTSNYDAAMKARERKVKSEINQVFTRNRNVAINLDEKIELIYLELMGKFEALSEHIKKLERDDDIFIFTN